MIAGPRANYDVCIIVSTASLRTKSEMTETASRARARARWYSPRSVGRSLALRPRVYIGALVGLAALLLLPGTMPASVREAVAWCLGGVAYLGMAFRVMTRCHSDRIRTRAARQDDSGVVILVVILLAMFSSFAAIVGLIGEAKGASSEDKLLFVGLAAATILISWTVTQVVFTLHYAHEHYAPHHLSEMGGAEALTFPGTPNPDYWDFFYFATSIGAASQTPDVNINAKALRRLVTLHAIVSFFFNTMVLALTINLAASLA
jgi:uncharacterized membrane protein